jgi:hypothetical protein
MSARPTTGSALDRLADLHQGVAAAERHVQEAQGALRRLPRRYESAKRALAAYFAGVGAGEPEDRERLAQLRGDVKDMEARLVQNVVRQRNGSDRVEFLDPEAEGRLAAALARVQEATSAVATFRAEHRVAIRAELLDEAQRAGDEFVDALGALLAASGRLGDLRRRWIHDGGAAPAEIPTNPLGLAYDDVLRLYEQVRGGAKDRRGVIPAPVSEVKQDGIRYAGDLPGWACVPRVVVSEGGLIGA